MMRSTHTHPGAPFAELTTAAFNAIARGKIHQDPEHPPQIVWDWDERTSRGARRRLVMHLVGLQLSPDDFDPSRNIEADFDEDDSPIGVYYADDWDVRSAATLLEAIGNLDADQRVLIAVWDSGRGYVGVLEGQQEYVSVNRDPRFDGVAWSGATLDAEPRWIKEHPSRYGVSLVMLDAHPPQDPGEHLDTSGLHGLRDALDELVYDCPFDVLVRDYAKHADHPPGDELTQVRGLAHRLRGIAEAHGRIKNREPSTRGSGGMGPFDWFLLHQGPHFAPIGHIVRIRGGTIVIEASAASNETWETMRRYGVLAGFDRVVIADHDYWNEPDKRQELFAAKLPEELREHNHQMTRAVRSVGANALDTRLHDLHAVWESLANWEGPVREDASAAEFIRAYAAPGTDWPTRQSKSSPTIVWISEDEGNRPAGYLEGLAGAYHADHDLLEINADFPSFQALQRYWAQRYLHADELSGGEMLISDITSTINEVVREWCEQTLVEVVVGVNQLAGRPGWDEARVRGALSAEALSGAALAIHHVQQSIKRSLGQRLGSLKEARTM
jgi:hypothetical protein